MIDQFRQEENQIDNNRTDLPHDEAAAPVLEEETAAEIPAPVLEEETASEVTPAIDNRRVYPPENRGLATGEGERDNREQMENIRTMEEEEAGGTALGWTAIVLSIIALFFFPLLLGTVGAITGFFAYRNGARALGMWSIAIGLFAIVMGVFFIPFIVR